MMENLSGSGRQLTAESLEAKLSTERGNSFPEVYANPPLDSTSVMYSVPVRGEWRNGHVKRMLHGMLSQRLDQGEAFEVNLVVNIGDKLYEHIARDDENRPLQDESGGILLNQQWGEQRMDDFFEESDESTTFIKQLIYVQQLARELQASPQDEATRQELAAEIESIEDPLLSDIAELAVKKADQVAVSLIDTTRTVFDVTDYRECSISSLRTMGADFARVRFKDKTNTVLSMYDADTIPGSNRTVAELQAIYKANPDINYMFMGMSNYPAGDLVALLEDAPRENIDRTRFYNSQMTHGSPQITFRLRAYDKLSEIAGWMGLGFDGDEDRDTSRRLIYRYSSLQSGSLRANATPLRTPTVLTADRLDGFVDSAIRKDSLERGGPRELERGLTGVALFQSRIARTLNSRSPEERAAIGDALGDLREHYLRRQAVQARFGRVVLSSLLGLIEKGLIEFDGDDIQYDARKIIHQRGGKALAHYLLSSGGIVKEVLSSGEDLRPLRYFAGMANEAPSLGLTPLQAAVREYVGEVRSTQDLAAGDSIFVDRFSSGNVIRDVRDESSKDSIMHTIVAEMLSLAQVHKTYMESEDFEGSTVLKYQNSQWPKNPDEQSLAMHFGDLGVRLSKFTGGADIAIGGESEEEDEGGGEVDQEDNPIRRLASRWLRNVKKAIDREQG